MEIKKEEFKEKFLKSDQSIFEDYYNSDMYIKMAHITTARSYWAFSVMIAVAVMTFTVLFNHYYSYDKAVLKQANIYLRNDHGIAHLSGESSSDTALFKTIGNGLNPISDEVRKNIIRNYIDANYITVPILGIKISIDDVMLLMGITFCILSCWLFYCIRSENLTIGKILSLNQNKRIDIRRYIFYGICFNNMFFPTTQRHRPYKELSKVNKSLNEELDDIPRKKARKKWKNELLSYIFFLPIVIMGMCFAHHIPEIYRMDSDKKDLITVEYEGEKYTINNAKIASFDSKGHVNYDGSNQELKRILYISCLITLLTFYQCYRTVIYQKGTNRILYDFKKRFKHEDDCLKNIENNKLENVKNELVVIVLAQKIVFSAKKCFQKYKEDFIIKYNQKNKYYFLTHTSGKDGEINKIKGFLTDGSNKYLPEGFKPPTDFKEFDNSRDINSYYCLFRRKMIKWFCKTGKPTRKKEYFLFLKAE
jgi:hypothetical protein